MKLTKKQAEEMKAVIDSMVDEPTSRYAEVQFSEDKDVLLKDKRGCPLIGTRDAERDLNNFEYFDKNNVGHAWIQGDVCPFEMVNDDGEVKFESNEGLAIRFKKRDEI